MVHAIPGKARSRPERLAARQRRRRARPTGRPWEEQRLAELLDAELGDQALRLVPWQPRDDLHRCIASHAGDSRRVDQQHRDDVRQERIAFQQRGQPEIVAEREDGGAVEQGVALEGGGLAGGGDVPLRPVSTALIAWCVTPARAASSACDNRASSRATQSCLSKHRSPVTTLAQAPYYSMWE